MNRTGFFKVIICAAFCGMLSAQSIALTLDDGPNLSQTPKWSAEERNRHLLDAFQERGVRVVLFANGIRGGDSPEGLRWLKAWGQAGHRIGNHTYSHLNLDEVGLTEFRADLVRLDGLIRNVPGYWPMLRFPFQQEGAGLAGRRNMRAVLKELGYLSAPVSIPTYDWMFNDRLQSLLRADPNANISPLRELYFQHLNDMLKGYRTLGRHVLGRDPAYTLLLHHNLLNAMVMPDLLRLLEVNGWSVISPEKAYEDPIYQEDLQFAPFSESQLSALAKRNGTCLDEVRELENRLNQQKALLQEYFP